MFIDRLHGIVKRGARCSDRLSQNARHGRTRGSNWCGELVVIGETLIALAPAKQEAVGQVAG